MPALRWMFYGFACAALLAGGALAQSQQARPSSIQIEKPEYECNFGNPDPQDRSGDSVLYRCHPRAGQNAPVFNVAVLKGTPHEVNRAHGYLLAREAEHGPIKEAIDLVNFGLSQHGGAIRPTLENVVTCFSDNLFSSLNAEFQDNVAAFNEGYRQRLGSAAKYPLPQLRLASIGIELDNVLAAVDYQHSKLGALLVAQKNCPGRLVLKEVLAGGLKLFGRDKGLGCTAFVVPEKSRDGAALTREGMIFGRTLDAELMRTWNTVPTLFLMHEEGRDDQGRPYLPYVATGAAGLIYSGGITGYNTGGIVASLHQMYASETILRVAAKEPRKAALAPVVQQIILREARSIDDAVRIAARFQAIATWTILIADAKTGESAAIEMSKGGVKLVRRTKGEPLAQTNHVFDKGQQAFAFFPNYNKYNESHTRMATLEKAFARIGQRAGKDERLEVGEVIAQLANHDDINGRFQPFGTTAVKAYDVMSTVLLPQVNKVYMTVGDFAPSPHAAYLGFQLDEKLNPVSVIGTLRDQSLAGSPGVLLALNDFVQARLAYEVKNYVEAERLLRQAIARAGGVDPSWAERRDGSLRVYNYVLARLLAMKATQGLYGRDVAQDVREAAYLESRRLFMEVIKDAGVLPYQRALAEYHQGLAELQHNKRPLGTPRLSPDAAALVGDALSVFQAKYQELKPTVDIKEMASNIANARKMLAARGSKSLKADDIDWVVMR